MECMYVDIIFSSYYVDITSVFLFYFEITYWRRHEDPMKPLAIPMPKMIERAKPHATPFKVPRFKPLSLILRTSWACDS